MKNIFEEDYPDRFSYTFDISLEYPHPFEKHPKEGIISIFQTDELGKFEWKLELTWEQFWDSIAARITQEYNPKGQSGFDNWYEESPDIGYEYKLGDNLVRIDVYIAYDHKFEDEHNTAQVVLVLKIDKRTGELSEWFVKDGYTNIAVITGEISSIIVVDCDSIDAFNDFNINGTTCKFTVED